MVEDGKGRGGKGQFQVSKIGLGRKEGRKEEAAYLPGLPAQSRQVSGTRPPMQLWSDMILLFAPGLVTGKEVFIKTGIKDPGRGRGRGRGPMMREKIDTKVREIWKT